MIDIVELRSCDLAIRKASVAERLPVPSRLCVAVGKQQPHFCIAAFHCIGVLRPLDSIFGSEASKPYYPAYQRPFQG